MLKVTFRNFFTKKLQNLTPPLTPVSEWYNYLNNNTIADAILDRIVHSSHRIELCGPSMRKIKSNIQNNISFEKVEE